MDKKEMIEKFTDWFFDEDVIKMVASIVLLVFGLLVLFSGIKGFDANDSIFARNVIKCILGGAASLFGVIPVIVAWCRWHDLDC